MLIKKARTKIGAFVGVTPMKISLHMAHIKGHPVHALGDPTGASPPFIDHNQSSFLKPVCQTFYVMGKCVYFDSHTLFLEARGAIHQCQKCVSKWVGTEFECPIIKSSILPGIPN